jgi:hypothetical protein
MYRQQQYKRVIDHSCIIRRLFAVFGEVPSFQATDFGREFFGLGELGSHATAFHEPYM